MKKIFLISSGLFLATALSCSKGSPSKPEKFHSAGAYNDYIVKQVDSLTSALRDIYEETGKEKTSAEQLDYFYLEAQVISKKVNENISELELFKGKKEFKEAALNTLSHLDQLLDSSVKELVEYRKRNLSLDEELEEISTKWIMLKRNVFIEKLRLELLLLKKKQEIFTSQYELELKRKQN